MTAIQNPFEYEQATKLTPEEVRKYYIEDFNYLRFIASRRNVFLVGERGTGKTMTFLYYALPSQAVKAKENDEAIDLSIVSIYVPCNNPLTHRREYELLDPLNASLVSEHFMVVSMMHQVLQAVYSVPAIATSDEETALRSEIEYCLNIDLPAKTPFKRALELALDRVNTQIQVSLNGEEEDIKKSFLSFNSGIRSFLYCLSQVERLRNSHFSFMMDDAQLYNPYQNRALNSWIAYRDNALFSFKVATTRVDAPPLETTSGGIILEGHDFTRLEMEQPYQNKASAFGQLARRIVQIRLDAIDVNKTPDDFFPESPSLSKAIEESGRTAEEEARFKYPNGTPKQLSDYKYKYTRAIYFRERSSRANLPPYSGFSLLTHLSTGVIRNLLNPCYKMYDRQVSESQDSSINSISPEIQKEVILDISKKMWEWIQNEMDNTIEGCSRDLARDVYRLLDNLAILFKKRLMSDISEPRAVEFTISGMDDNRHAYLLNVLKIAQKAQLIYTYRSSAKDRGRRETYYMPNKMLWPERGLDPEGQHARVSITADNLLAAVKNNTEIPCSGAKTNEPDLFASEV
jgi:hypothetical protein